MIYLRLFWEFFKAGLFAVGGGMATIPFLQDISETTQWFTTAKLADMIAISESTPGPIGVNMATYVGYKTAGIFGGFVATMGLVFPSVIIILMVAAVLDKFRTNKYVESGFYGLRPASTALIASALVSVVLITFTGAGDFQELVSPEFVLRFDWRYLVLAAVIVVLSRFVPQTKKLHPIIFIAIGAAVGIIFRF